MGTGLRIRLLTREDLAFADSLRALAGWNQTRADWERLFEHDADGCFLAEWDGAPAGTTTTTRYGREVGWIGMLLVHPEYRRRGIGRALLERGVTHLRSRNVQCIKLDATPAGRPVYAAAGFQEEWSLMRWQREAVASREIPADDGLRGWRESDLPGLAALEARAFGVPRPRLLEMLTRQSSFGRVVEESPGQVAGFGLLRPGSRASFLGPVVADTVERGLRLMDSLLACLPGGKVFCDIPDLNRAATAWAQERGFTEQRPLTRMFLGENIAPGRPELQFALAGPEVG